MTLKKQIVELNRQHIDNDFKVSLLAAKRSADKNRDSVVVRVRYQNVELYEALPAGWPLADVARRLGLDCSTSDLEIVALRSALTGKWRRYDD